MKSGSSFCSCHQCKAARRKGLILGARWQQSWKDGLMKVSGYVPYHRFVRGRRPDQSAPTKRDLVD